MSCAHLDERLTELIDGRLSTDDRTEVEAHLADCANCSETLALMRRAAAAVSGLPRESAPSGLLADLKVRLAAETAPARVASPGGLSAGMRSALAAGLVTVLISGGMLLLLNDLGRSPVRPAERPIARLPGNGASGPTDAFEKRKQDRRDDALAMGRTPRRPESERTRNVDPNTLPRVFRAADEKKKGSGLKSETTGNRLEKQGEGGLARKQPQASQLKKNQRGRFADLRAKSKKLERGDESEDRLRKRDGDQGGSTPEKLAGRPEAKDLSQALRPGRRSATPQSRPKGKQALAEEGKPYGGADQAKAPKKKASPPTAPGKSSLNEQRTAQKKERQSLGQSGGRGGGFGAATGSSGRTVQRRIRVVSGDPRRMQALIRLTIARLGLRLEPSPRGQQAGPGGAHTLRLRGLTGAQVQQVQRMLAELTVRERRGELATLLARAQKQPPGGRGEMQAWAQAGKQSPKAQDKAPEQAQGLAMAARKKKKDSKRKADPVKGEKAAKADAQQFGRSLKQSGEQPAESKRRATRTAKPGKRGDHKADDAVRRETRPPVYELQIVVESSRKKK